jgi:hypothetical protein
VWRTGGTCTRIPRMHNEMELARGGARTWGVVLARSGERHALSTLADNGAGDALEERGRAPMTRASCTRSPASIHARSTARAGRARGFGGGFREVHGGLEQDGIVPESGARNGCRKALGRGSGEPPARGMFGPWRGWSHGAPDLRVKPCAQRPEDCGLRCFALARTGGDQRRTVGDAQRSRRCSCSPSRRPHDAVGATNGPGPGAPARAR